MKLPKDIKDEIWQYCKANNITNVDEFINNMVSRGFTAEKFGAVPWEKPAKVKEVEKIVEKEVIKEVPVEVIKEVEKIVEKKVEVPVEVIKEVVVEKKVPVEVIKEVEKIIEKEIYITDNKEIGKLADKISELEDDITINNEIKEEVEKELNIEIETLNQKVADLNNNILQLENDLDKKKVEIDKLTIKTNDTSKDDEIDKLKENLELFKNESKDRGKIINDLNKKIDGLESTINSETKEDNSGDIYGDNKKGLFGSNISDIWNKKK